MAKAETKSWRCNVINLHKIPGDFGQSWISGIAVSILDWYVVVIEMLQLHYNYIIIITSLF